jgi:glutamate synthase domain-containing protein 2
MGMPVLEGVRLVHGFLTGAGIRSDIKVIAAGKVYNGFSLVRMIASGADLCNAARAFMFSLGCIQALKCNSNNCPTGITTQRPELMSGLDIDNKAIRVANFHRSTIHSAQEIIGAMGCRSASEINGEHIYKRHEGIHATTYDEMHSTYFPLLKNRELVDEEMSKAAPLKYTEWWNKGKEICDRMGDN